ncbi:3 beta-hydroxysteroid dehydrogenase/Delta 5--_4-isomerase type 1-like [Mytilus californianus]|uniref:3 beta-hydroxysteroid dehydrogenase/Delta 5-->4-isomerase type 1-like n=1 Tax=Mytilus californianus TaxID=6549 RepID=UPI0022480FF1|nr:3 beta-hydroxysteroid dehydrogenase/Delta 5-->4-isomerase type 1-like [Mytilus californianus]
MMKKFVVLVTGGSGFLGQHVIKHLQIYAENVREIRVLDMVSYEQKLDFQASKPLRIFAGSITDSKLVGKACRGTDIVLHIASKIDYSNFPDKKVLQEVNIKGTETVLNACWRGNVPYLIYCGSASIYFGGEEARAATETTIKTPSKLCFGEYAKTKTEAQNMVLSANDSYLQNGKQLKTLALLPFGMYGELDYGNIPAAVRPFKGRTFPLVGQMKAKIQYSYVGNVAMMFVKAVEKLPKDPKLGGQYFFSVDDTPPDTVPGVLKPFLDHFSSKPSSWYIPYWLAIVMVFLITCLTFLLRFFTDSHLPLSHFTFGSIAYLNTTFYVTNDKARRLLGYTPVYDYNNAIEQSNKFYEKVI